MPEKNTISACLVAHNEEKLIGRCLESVKNLVDEIIVVHDGPCQDKTLGIAKKYTDKVFVRDSIGTMEPHLIFAYKQAQSEWLLRIDPDEFFDGETIGKIKDLLRNTGDDIDCYTFNWEMWDGIKNIYSRAFQKRCLFRKSGLHFMGVMHADSPVDGKNIRVNLRLRHQPLKNNVSWKNFFPKMKYQIGVHSRYFFPEMCHYEAFNMDVNVWLKHTAKIRKNIWRYIILEPIKQFLGQMKNGLWDSWPGFNIAVQQYVYFLNLYWRIWKMQRQAVKQ